MIQRRTASGFTLLEMLIVMVMIGLLAGLVGPRIFGRVDTSKVQTAKVQIKMLESSLLMMKLDVNKLPDDDRALQWLTKAPTDEAAKSTWRGPYMEGALPLDPWGGPYKIKTPGLEGKTITVMSYGADGKAGGEGLDADIFVQ